MDSILEDIRVLDLTHVWFGPWCTMMLADFGAEVIRVEPPWGAIDRIAEGARFGGASYTFHHLNLNKKSLTINLKTSEGIEIFEKLVKESDVVVQNFRPGTMDRLGLSYERLKMLNSKIIYAALSGFGQYGPYSSRGSYAPIAESMSGHTRLTGDGVDPEGPPILMAESYGDLGPGTLAAMSIIAAIRYRDKTGKGQMIDVAQLDCMVALNTAVTGYLLSGMKPWEMQVKYPGMSGIRDLMKTRDNKWIMIRIGTPASLDRLREYFGTEELKKEMIKEMVSKMTRDEALAFFIENRIPVGPVYHVNEVIKDPHLISREMFIEVNHLDAGKIKVVNFPIKFSQTPVRIRGAAPLLGQHNREILIRLGYNEEDIIKLKQSGVIAYA